MSRSFGSAFWTLVLVLLIPGIAGLIWVATDDNPTRHPLLFFALAVVYPAVYVCLLVWFGLLHIRVSRRRNAEARR